MPTKMMLSVILVPAILACLAHSRGMPIDRTLGELDNNAKECLDGLDACQADFESADSTTGQGAYDTCVTKLTTKHGPGCRRHQQGNLDGALYDYPYTEVASERRCRELANLHHRPNPPDPKIVVAWSWGRLPGQPANSNPICQLHTKKGKVVQKDKEHKKINMVWGERISIK